MMAFALCHYPHRTCYRIALYFQHLTNWCNCSDFVLFSGPVLLSEAQDGPHTLLPCHRLWRGRNCFIITIFRVLSMNVILGSFPHGFANWRMDETERYSKGKKVQWKIQLGVWEDGWLFAFPASAELQESCTLHWVLRANVTEAEVYLIFQVRY